MYPLWKKSFKKKFVLINKIAVSVWTEGQNGKKKMRFQMKT